MRARNGAWKNLRDLNQIQLVNFSLKCFYSGSDKSTHCARSGKLLIQRWASKLPTYFLAFSSAEKLGLKALTLERSKGVRNGISGSDQIRLEGLGPGRFKSNSELQSSKAAGGISDSQIIWLCRCIEASRRRNRAEKNLRAVR